MIRLFVAASLALVLSVMTTAALINLLTRRKIGQPIHEDVPEGHTTKAGTPTMGGLAIVAGAVASYTVSAAYRGIYSNMGEVGNADSRLLVDRSIRKKFVERFIELGRDAFKPGDPLDPGTNMGPLVTRGDQKRVLAMIEKGRKEGAKLEFGGDAPAKLKQGAYVNPTLFTGVKNDMSIAEQEIFGPVASVIEFNGADEAIKIANNTIYGLAAGVWTRDIDTAFRLVRSIEAGVVWVNCFDEGDMTQPFGGYKQSGNARDKCLDSFKSYTQSKSAWFRLQGG